MKSTRVVALIVACLFIFGPAAMYTVGVRPEAFENHPLAPAPTLDDGWKLFDVVTPWATDHLPGRKQAVYANGWIDYHAFASLPRTTADTAGKAPTVVRGKNGYLFLGEDFDRACLDGKAVRRSFNGFARLASVIRSSGRDVVFTVAPNKSAVIPSDLPRVLPHGQCAARGLVRGTTLLSRLSAPGFVDSYDALARAQARGQQTFWKTDTHWNDVGSALYAEALGRATDLRRKPRLVPGRTTGVKDLIKLAGLNFPETSPSLTIDTGGTVRELPGSERYDRGNPQYGINRWRTSPGDGLVQGRTVLIGDSFTYYGLHNLRPLFAEGTFLWTGHVTTAQLVAQIKASSTVVIEVVQRSLHNYGLARSGFRHQVAAALRADDD